MKPIMKPIMIMKKEYDTRQGLEITDDVLQAFAEIYKDKFYDLPVDEKGNVLGSFIVTVEYLPLTL